MTAATEARGRFALITLAAWAAIGAVTTKLDLMHRAAGITTYPDAHWIGEVLPFSPAYVFGALGAYALHAAIVRTEASPRGYLGGAPVTWKHAAIVALRFSAAYAFSSLLSGAGRENSAMPFVCAFGLAIWALWLLRSRVSSRLLVFVVAVAIVGPLFEWFAVSRGAFAYGICPSRACLGAPVAMLWLPWIYAHAALVVHDLVTPGAPR